MNTIGISVIAGRAHVTLLAEDILYICLLYTSHAAPEHHPVPAGVQRAAEAGGQNAPEQTHRNIVQHGNNRAHTITRLFRKAYSRYVSLTSLYFPRGSGISVRQDMVTARAEIFRTYSRLTR